ncbi:MAG: hypothetical protein JWM11_6376 [Planctomycetaceae bacterium]|nr:hypothetical protein [Planctomycetaceae bacterium]
MPLLAAVLGGNSAKTRSKQHCLRIEYNPKAVAQANSRLNRSKSCVCVAMIWGNLNVISFAYLRVRICTAISAVGWALLPVDDLKGRRQLPTVIDAPILNMGIRP